MNDIDAKDFLILKEIYRTKSVSAIVEKICMGQSSISIRLGKLRKHFNDPLFVRTSTGMQPTPRMEALISPIGDALALFNGSAGAAAGFDPAVAGHTFRLCIGDTCQIVLLPRLLRQLQHVAPAVRIDLTGLSSDTVRQLESGDADVAIGLAEGVPCALYQQKLFDEHFVCVAATNHPRIGAHLTMQQFLLERHVEVDLPSDSGQRALTGTLEALGIARNAVLRVPSFLGVARIVAHSDLIALVPLQLANLLQGEGGVRIVALPIAMPVYSVRQHWHERFHAAPANRWFRKLIADICADIGVE